MAIQLRDYQLQSLEKINQAFQSCQSVLFQMPTGTGKTVLFSALTHQYLQNNKKVLIIVHRRELIDQAITHLRHYNIEAGTILSKVKPDSSLPIQVASIQTLTRREPFHTDLVIIDEAHHSCASSYTKLWLMFPDAKFLGVTATPIRLDNKGLGDVYDTLITSDSFHHFVKDKHLVPVRQYIGSLPDLKNVKMQAGDYNIKQLQPRVTTTSVIGGLIKSYESRALNKSCIVFAVDVNHSLQIVELYRKHGYTAEHIDGDTPYLEREDILKRFKNKEIQVLCNVGIITEGFDMPDCEVVQLARPTKSLGLYLQMTGRVMRPAEGKKEGIVLDCAGLWRNFGTCQKPRKWHLHQSTEESEESYFLLGEGNTGMKERQLVPLEDVNDVEIIELVDESQRLEIFQEYIVTCLGKKWKLLSAYYKYLSYLDEHKQKMSENEFQYVATTLKHYNKKVSFAQQFKAKFLEYEKERYFSL